MTVGWTARVQSDWTPTVQWTDNVHMGKGTMEAHVCDACDWKWPVYGEHPLRCPKCRTRNWNSGKTDGGEKVEKVFNVTAYASDKLAAAKRSTKTTTTQEPVKKKAPGHDPKTHHVYQNGGERYCAECRTNLPK